MSLADQAVAELESTEQFFNRSTRSLTEEHSGVKPAPDVMTAAQQVAHAAQTIDWFIEGAFRREGFDTNFQAHAKAIENCTSLTDARAWFAKAVAVAKGHAVLQEQRGVDGADRRRADHGRRTPHGHHQRHHRPHRAPSRRADRLRARQRARAAPCRTWTSRAVLVAAGENPG